MRLQTFVWGSVVLLLSSTGLSTADAPDCPNGFQVIELQPYEVICDGTTSASTRTRSYTIPFEPLSTNPPGQNDTPGPPNGPGKPQIPGQPATPANPNPPPVQPNPPGQPQVPGQPIVPGHPESPNEPESPPGAVTITITGIPPLLKTESIPPPRGGFRTITKYVFPPPVPGTTTSFVTGPTPGTTTVPPAPGCSGSDCAHTIVVTVPGPIPSLTARTTTTPQTPGASTVVVTGPPPLDPPNTRFITTTVPGTTPGTITIPPASDCKTSCVETVVVTTVPTTPPNTAITLTEVCTATTFCEPITMTPRVDCVRPCTTTVITYPPNTPSFTTTPPDVITTITGTCTSTGSCEPVITIPPANNCKHPCTTTVITYPPRTPSRTTTPPDIITTITEPCPSTGTCEPVVTVPPPSDCTHPCTTSVFVRPSSSVSLTTTPPPDVITTVTEPCPSTGTCEPIVTVPPPSDCTRPCTTTVRVRGSTSSSEAPSPTTDGSTSTEEPSTTETSSTQESTPRTTTVPPATDCSTDCTTTVRVTTVPPLSTEESTTTTTKATSTTRSASTSEEPTTTSTEPTTTSEPTTTADASTTTASPTPSLPPSGCFFTPGTCDTSSLSLDLYANSVQVDDGYGVSDGSSGVGPDYYLSQSSLDQGSTTSLSVPGGDNDDATGDPSTPQNPGSSTGFQYHPGLTKTYGGMTFNANNFTIVFTGYFVPQETGDYTFCTTADNRDAIYIGSDTAFPCGDASNNATPSGANPLVEYWFARDDEQKCATINMVAGFYYPFRQVYGNWGTPSSLQVTVQGPGDDSASSDVTGKVSPNNCV